MAALGTGYERIYPPSCTEGTHFVVSFGCPITERTLCHFAACTIHHVQRRGPKEDL